MSFPIALLGIAALFFLVAVIGRDFEGGTGNLTLKITGKVGPFPRMILLLFSVLLGVVSLIAFALVLEVQHPAGFNALNGTPAPPATTNSLGSTDPRPSSANSSQVDVQLTDTFPSSVGSEQVQIIIDRQYNVTMWANGNNQRVAKTIALPPGTHQYLVAVQVTLTGSPYTFGGQGTIVAQSGSAYTVVLYSANYTALLQPV